MSINGRKSLPWSDRQRVQYECLRCGTTVDAGTDGCPMCGSERFARTRLLDTKSFDTGRTTNEIQL